MTPQNHLVNRFILPDLKVTKFKKISNKTFHLQCIKTTKWEVCRKCPTKSYSVHDRRNVTIRDAKLRGKNIRIVNFYNIKGYNQAKRIFIKITDDIAYSRIKEIRTLRKTLMKWRDEILRYFETGLTNARVEEFNRKCKLIQRNAYGFRSFENYRLRVLYML